MAEREYRQFRFRRPPGACEMLLVRHGESVPSRGEPFVMTGGHADPPLDPVGERQAVAVADRLVASGERIAAVYVSTLVRTQQTAAPFAERTGMVPVVEADLREVHLGEWERDGTFRKHVSEGHPLAAQMMLEQRWDVLPGAEPGDVFAARVNGAITRLAARHADETIAVFVHGAVIGQVLAHASASRGFAFTGADNGSISHVVVAPDGRWIIRTYNDTSHLGPRFTEGSEPLT